MDAIAHDNYLLMIRVVTILECIAAQHDFEEKIIFRRVCQQLIMHYPYRMAWIVSAETDGSIKPIAAEGIGSSALFEISQRWDRGSGRESPMTEYIHNQMLSHIINETDEALTLHSKEYGDDWKDFINKSKINSIFLEPIFINNQFIGALGICSEVKNSFKGNMECALLKLVARHVGYAISMMRNHNTITEMQMQIELSATVFDNTCEGIIITDQHGVISAVNPALISATGYTKEELIGSTARIFQSKIHDKIFYSDIWQSIMETGYWSGEIWNKRKNGDICPELLNVTTVKDAQGKIKNYIAVLTDITKQKCIEEQLHKIASHDDLTGLPNHILFKDRLNLAIANAHRNQQMLAILFIDLDRFKDINDTLGHTYGDKLLHEVAKRLSKSVRDSDTVARQGGDEFISILQSLSTPEDAITVAKKMLYELETPVIIEEREVFISASIGISFYPNDGETPEVLMKNADTAMYIAKESGRNCYQLYATAMNSHFHERMALENDLRYALERNELVLFYQPQIELESGKVNGVEALLRWQHPTRGLIAPSEFISIAEKSGLIIPIGNWILHEACTCMKRWQNAGANQISVAVNLSARQFMQPSLSQIVAEALSKSGLLPHFLELEITESCLMISKFENAAASKHMVASKDTAAMLQTLKQIGVRIAIDDFGTGYSNLGYLKKFPIDSLKIDQSLVYNIDTNHSDRAIVRAIIAMADSLGLTVIAEGVETTEQLESLSWEQCAVVQGYLFGKPMSAHSCGEFLEQSANDELATQIRKRMCAAI